jgi:hypothetical protein
MGFMTKKRDVDFVSIVSIALSAAIITFLSAWLYYGNKVDKMKESYEVKVGIFKDNSQQMMEKTKSSKRNSKL